MSETLNPPLLGAIRIGTEELEAVSEVLLRRQLFRHTSDGVESQNTLFEAELGRYLGTSPARAVHSGTAGLRAALLACGVGKDDVVLVSAYTFVATASAVISVGAHPVPVDLGEDLGVDLDDLRAKLPGAKAVIPVNVPGHACNTRDVASLALTEGATVIEDACQALGVTSNGHFAGTIGDIGIFSFQQAKQLCSGEGGAVVSSDSRLLAHVRRISDHGACRTKDDLPTWKPVDACFGENLRLGELEAAVLRAQLVKLPRMLERQRCIRNDIRRKLYEVRAMVVDSVDPEGDSGSSLLVLANSRSHAEDLLKRAATVNVTLFHPWNQPFCDLPVFRRTGRAFPGCNIPRARGWARRLLSIPIPPIFDKHRTSTLVDAVRKVFVTRK